MNKNNLMLLAVVILGVGGYLFFSQSRPASPESAEQTNTPNEQDVSRTENTDETPSPSLSQNEGETSTPESQENQLQATITYTDSGFSPNALTVKMGTVVTFVNNSSEGMWIASANHPIHALYPGSSISKCGTVERGIIFDACAVVTLGETFQFRFDNIGAWGYHNHGDPRQTGTIIVTP